MTDLTVEPWAEMRWSGIGAAAFLIALDNGGINRDRTISQWQRDFRKWIAARPDDMLAPIDAWLRSLSEEQLELVCCGGVDEPETDAAKTGAPPFMDDLLNDYFDEVC